MTNKSFSLEQTFTEYYNSGLSYPEISKRLNSEGFLTKRKSHFTPARVCNLRVSLNLPPRNKAQSLTSFSEPDSISIPVTNKKTLDITKALTIDDITLFLTIQNEQGSPFPINFDYVLFWLDYARKSTAVDLLIRNFKEGLDFNVVMHKGLHNRITHVYWLTVEAFQEFCTISMTSKAIETRRLIIKGYNKYIGILHNKSKKISPFPEIPEDIFKGPEMVTYENPVTTSYREEIDYRIKRYTSLIINAYYDKHPLKITDREHSFYKKLNGVFVRMCRFFLNTRTSSISKKNIYLCQKRGKFKNIMDYAESSKSSGNYKINGVLKKTNLIELMHYLASALFPIPIPTDKSSNTSDGLEIPYISFELLSQTLRTNPTYKSEFRDIMDLYESM